MISDETGDRFQEQYGIDGYTDSIVFIKLDKLVELDAKLGAIQTEINTYHGRRMTVIDYKRTAHFTIELIDKILDGSYFKENSEQAEKKKNVS